MEREHHQGAASETSPRREPPPQVKQEKRKNLETLLREGFYANIVIEGYMHENIWSREIVARDFLQNFFDANHQTLDGVTIDINELPNQTVEVIVRSAQSYPYSRIVSLGGGHKDDPDRSAGGKHQGTKDTAVMGLREYGCQTIEFGSKDWKLTFFKDALPEGYETTAKNPLHGLYIKLEDADEVQGNYLRFVTHDKEMAAEMIKARELFYYEQNHEFAHPDIETSDAGFRVLPAQENGNLYINGQRISYAEMGRWNTIPGFTFWSKRTPIIGQEKLKINRDRDVVNPHDFENIFLPFLINSMSAEERELALVALDDFASYEFIHDPQKAIGKKLLKTLLKALKKDGYKKVFPRACLANDRLDTGSMPEAMRQMGYLLYEPEFADIGMTKVSETLKNAEQDQEVQGSPEERARAQLLVDYTHDLLTSVRHTLDITPKEIRFYVSENPIFVGKYDRGEVWIALRQTRLASCAAPLGTYFHELCHKFGTDESAAFSYKLTDLLRVHTQYCISHPEALPQLEKAWQAISVQPSWKNMDEFRQVVESYLQNNRCRQIYEQTTQKTAHTRSAATDALIGLVTQNTDTFLNADFIHVWHELCNLPIVKRYHKLLKIQRHAQTLEGLNQRIEREKLEEASSRQYKKIWELEKKIDEIRKGINAPKRRKSKLIEEYTNQIDHLKQAHQKILDQINALKQTTPNEEEELEVYREILFPIKIKGVSVRPFDLIHPDAFLFTALRVLSLSSPDGSHAHQMEDLIEYMNQENIRFSGCPMNKYSYISELIHYVKQPDTHISKMDLMITYRLFHEAAQSSETA